jgi:hypothetical protein
MDLNQTSNQMEMFGYTAEGAQQEAEKFVDKDAAPAKDITFMDAAKFVAELTPVIGDAMAAKEVYDELQKDDPNYFLAGALGGAAIIGLIPGIGDAAASAIRAGARKAFDVGKNVEINPNVMSAFGAGAIRKKPSLTLDDFGYKEDNPVTKGFGGSEDWLSGKIEQANKSKNLLDGATTAFLGTNKDKPLFLDTDFISSLKGARGEVRKKGEPQYDRLKKTVDERSKFFEKYGGIPKRVSTADSNVSGTRARNAAKANNKEELFSYFPNALSDAQKEEIYKMLLSVVAEQIDFKSLEQQLDNMFAELDIDVAFTTHFKERVLERGLTEDDILELAEKIIDAYPDQLDFLNQGQNIVMSHLSRLVDIAAVNTGYGDDYLKDLVFKTAFKRKDKSEPEFRTNASSPRLAVKEKKDPKKGTGKKPKGSSRRLYTDEDPKDTVRVKFSTRQDIVDTLNKKSFKAKSHARQSQIINLIHQRVRAAYNRAKDPDVKKRLKTALDYAEQRKEASKAKTQRLKKQKTNEGDTIEKYSAKGKKTGKLKQGTVRKRLNIPKDEKIPMYKINKELSRLKKMDKDEDKKGVQLGDKNQKYYKALQLAKTLKTTTHVNEGIIDVTPEEEKLLRKIAKEYIIPALKNRTHNKVLATINYKLSNGEDGKVGFYVYNKDDSSAAHFNSRDDKNRFDNLIGINAFENELAFAGGLERIYTRLTGDSPFRDLLDSLRHEFIHAKDPGANDDTFAAKHTGKTFADYYGGWIEFPAQTGEFLLAIKNNALDYVEEKGRLTTKDTEYLSNVFQDILDFYARNASMAEMSQLVIDFFNQGKSTGFQKFVKKIIDFGGDTLGIRTTPEWSQSDAFEKFYTKLRRIRNFNEEGYKEFQKDLYVLIQKLIEQINKDLPQGVKPIYAGGKNRLNENASYSKEINIKEKIDQLTQHMIDKGMNIEPLPSLELINGDTENARDFFGKTAYYDPKNILKKWGSVAVI